MDDAFFAKELKNFLDADGRLKVYPSKRRPKIIALFYLAGKIAPGRRYTEKEINCLLRSWHTFEDWCMLRRDLYDRGFLGREADGALYWAEEAPPRLEDFELA